MRELLDLFWTFARVGGLTFGGGYAMLPILQREMVEKRQWVSDEELMDYYAIGQCTPGIIAVNTATFVGQKRKGIVGGIVATLGVVFPSLVIITIIAAFIQNFADLAVVKNAFAGIRVCVCVLILNAVIKLLKKLGDRQSDAGHLCGGGCRVDFDQPFAYCFCIAGRCCRYPAAKLEGGRFEMIYLRLFYEFFKAGLFSIGGGLATLPFLYDISDTTGWFTHGQLADMLAISESTPGPIGINMATYVGFTTGGIPGAVIATVGIITPSIIVILLIARFLKAFRDNKYVKGGVLRTSAGFDRPDYRRRIFGCNDFFGTTGLVPGQRLHFRFIELEGSAVGSGYFCVDTAF